MVQIHIFLLKNIRIDLDKDLFYACVQIVVHKIVDRHEAWSRCFLQKPQKTDICFTQFFYGAHRNISVFHKCEQDYFQEGDGIILRAACSAFLYRKISI